MPADPTLSTLRSGALDYADMTGSSFPVTAQVTTQINRSIARLHDKAASVAGLSEYVRSTASITLVPGTTSYTIAADFYRVLGVYYLGSGNNRLYPIERWVGIGSHGYKRGPLQAGTVEVDYFPEAPVLVSDSNKVTDVTTGGWGYGFSSAWPEWVALDTAVYLLMREESFEAAAALRSKRDEVWSAVADSMTPRDLGQSQSVADVYGRWSGGAEPITEDRSLKYRLNGAQSMDFIELEVGGY